MGGVRASVRGSGTTLRLPLSRRSGRPGAPPRRPSPSTLLSEVLRAPPPRLRPPREPLNREKQKALPPKNPRPTEPSHTTRGALRRPARLMLLAVCASLVFNFSSHDASAQESEKQPQPQATPYFRPRRTATPRETSEPTRPPAPAEQPPPAPAPAPAVTSQP